MKRLVIFSFLFLMTSLPLFAQGNGTLSFFSGEVKIKEKGEISWQPAKLNMSIKAGDEIKTGPDSKAEIRIGNDLIKIDGNTHFVVAELAKKNLFEVALGKAWFRVKKIRGKEIEVRTPTAVVGVRGTIFSVEVRDGITLLDVLKGMVEALIKENSFIVRGGEGLRADPAGPIRRKLTPDEKKVFRKNMASLTLEGQRSNLQMEVRSVRTEFARERIEALMVKARDFSAGRSMRDVHQNLVRVEQHLYRPTNSSLRFFNINKRETNIGDVTNFNYLKNEIVFNKELPEDISKWPEWIANEIEEDKEVSTTNFEQQDNLQPQETTSVSSTDLHPELMETIISNGRPDDEGADQMRWYSQWDKSKEQLKEAEFSINGVKYYREWGNDPDFVEPGYSDLQGENVKVIYDCGVTDAKGEEAGRLKLHSWLINNDGKVMTEERLEKMNFFEALKETGYEFRVESFGETPLLNKPIDIIFTADIIIAALRELAGAVTAATIEAE